MIRVALHVVAGSRGGPRTYGVALAEALARRDDVDLVVLTDRPQTFPGIPTVRLRGPRPYADHVVVPRVLGRLAPDVYHNTKNALPRKIACPSVVTLHDLAYLHFPETFGWLSRAYLKWHHEHAAKHAHRIIAPSEHAASDISNNLDVARHRLRVVHHGVAPAFHEAPPEPTLDLPRPYILSVGTIQARKNLDVLVEAVALLRAYRREPFELVIAGRRGWKTDAFDAACRKTPVRLLGVVDDKELPSLYANAAAFVQPSSYEGFGLTAAEALATGVPVIAAEAGSLPEVVGDAGILVPPRSAPALATAIERVLDDGPLAAKLRAAGLRRAQEFSWDRSAQEHLDVYRDLKDTKVPV